MARVSRSCRIDKDQDDWIENNVENFSGWVREKLDEERGESDG